MISFDSIYQKYSEDVYKFVLWLSGNIQDAEDITSETFTKLWISDTKIKTQTLKAYLFTIARNLYLQKIRNKKKFVEIEETIQDQNPHPEKIVETKSELDITLKAVQQLKEPDRTILILHSQHEISYPEIAQLTGISEAAIKVKVYRARLKLAKYLKGDKNEGNT